MSKTPIPNLVLYLSLLCFASACIVAQEGMVRFAEQSLRANAIKSVVPMYPSSALRLRQEGVAVAQLYFDEKGVVRRVDVLEAPSATIADSVKAALSQWRFGSDLVSRGGSFTGKLTFYFVISKGKSRVLEPDQTGYVGHF